MPPCLAAEDCHMGCVMKKTAIKPDNPEEYRRFLDLAREVGAEKPSKDFDRVLDKVAEREDKPPRSTAGPKKTRKN